MDIENIIENKLLGKYLTVFKYCMGKEDDGINYHYVTEEVDPENPWLLNNKFSAKYRGEIIKIKFLKIKKYSPLFEITVKIHGRPNLKVPIYTLDTDLIINDNLI